MTRPMRDLRCVLQLAVKLLTSFHHQHLAVEGSGLHAASTDADRSDRPAAYDESDSGKGHAGESGSGSNDVADAINAGAGVGDGYQHLSLATTAAFLHGLSLLTRRVGTPGIISNKCSR